MTRILFLGDIVGETGISGVERTLPTLIDTHQPDVVFANIENSAGGFGITLEGVERLRACGIDACTTGNHVFDRPGYEDIFASGLPVIRPANWPGVMPGKGSMIVRKNDVRILLMNILGRLWTLDPPPEDPFSAVDGILDMHRGQYDIAMLDIHAETTSEKRAIAEYVDGRIHCVVGTHTHVQTNDARTLPRGTGFLTDVGMCGPERSIIGFAIDAFTQRMRTGVPIPGSVPKGLCEIAGCIADIINGSTTIRTFRHITDT